MVLLATLRVNTTKLVRTTVRYDSFPVSDLRRHDAKAREYVRNPIVRVSSQNKISIRFAKVFLKGVDLCASSSTTLPAVVKIKDCDMFASCRFAYRVLPSDTQEPAIT
jgi:hypothetical protein